MHKQLVIVKLGGGLVTDKNQPFTSRKSAIRLLASEIGKLYRENPETDFLLGNGGGSFAHFTAHEYGLRSGASDPDQYYGMCLAHHGVQRLNGMIVDALVDEGVPAFGISPASILMSRDAKLDDTFIPPVKHLLSKNCVPVIHGDTICDTVKGTSIFSAEECLYACIEPLRESYSKMTVIFATDVDGVADKDGETIPVLDPEEQIVVDGQLVHDVTSGIYGKVETARKAALLVDEVYIVDGGSKGVLAKALQGQTVGTKILPPKKG